MDAVLFDLFQKIEDVADRGMAVANVIEGIHHSTIDAMTLEQIKPFMEDQPDGDFIQQSNRAVKQLRRVAETLDAWTKAISAKHARLTGIVTDPPEGK